MYGQSNLDGASYLKVTKQIDDLGAGIMRDVVCSRLAADTGEDLETNNGQEIVALEAFALKRQAIIEDALAKAGAVMSSMLEDFATNLVASGSASAPLHTSSNTALCTNQNVIISAQKPLMNII